MIRAGLRQFFSFFGSKVALAKHYPPPAYGQIVEPFAGSAGYSCLYYDRDIHLFDVDPTIVDVWRYLIAATAGDILALPLRYGDCASLTSAEKSFIGFWWRRCGAVPSAKPVPWALSGKYNYSFWSRETRARIATQVRKIDHWRVEQIDYSDIGNRAATWFIDPPYVAQGFRYAYSAIDRGALAAFARSRSGQVIVCEDAAADWLPFTPLYEHRTVKYKKVARTISEGMFTITTP